MASTCPVDLDILRLRAEVESIYRRVATEPSGDFHFHRFRGTSKEGVARKYGVVGVNVHARKPR